MLFRGNHTDRIHAVGSALVPCYSSVKIKKQNGPVRVSIQRVKPARVDDREFTIDIPKRRGRPRKNRPLGGSTVAPLYL